MRTRLVSTLVFGTVAVCSLVATPAVSAPPCPKSSAPDRHGWLSVSLAAKCVIGPREGKIARGDVSYYNIYCPTRLGRYDIEQLGRGILAGTHKIVGGSQIAYEHAQSGPLKPIYKAVPHIYEYACSDQGKPGVATHFKLGVLAHDTTPVASVAARCSTKKRAFGAGQRMDIEYECPYPIRADDGRQFAQSVATHAVKRDFTSAARAVSARICLLRSTDAQCAPCEKTNKLVARTRVVGKYQPCPVDTYATVQ